MRLYALLVYLSLAVTNSCAQKSFIKPENPNIKKLADAVSVILRATFFKTSNIIYNADHSSSDFTTELLSRKHPQVTLLNGKISGNQLVIIAFEQLSNL